jgi:ABC-2 type transport system permease protein
VSQSSFWSVARSVAWRNLRVTLRSPSLLLPALLFPIFFFIAFVGALSSLADVQGVTTGDYTGFLFVFVLMQSAGFTGALGGIGMVEDFETGFIQRLMAAAPHRLAIVFGYAAAMFLRGVVAVVVLTAVALAFGMNVDGGPLDLVGLYGLAALLNLATTFWGTALALLVRSFQAAAAITLPLFLLLFLAPVYVPLDQLKGWLHAVASANPLSYVLESGRGFLAGSPVDVLPAYGASVGLVVVLALFTLVALRSAERAG